MNILFDLLKKFLKAYLLYALFMAAITLLVWGIVTSEPPEPTGYGLGFTGESSEKPKLTIKQLSLETDSPEYQKALKEIDINNPRTCQPCHQAIYMEWHNSYHRFAHEDFLFRTFMFYNAETDKPGIPWCENCHISESTLEVEPLKQPVSRRDAKSPLRLGDGIDCASCHRRGNQIVGRNGTAIGCQAVGDKNFGTPKYCGGCHMSFMPNTLHEYEEWIQNPKPISVKKTCVKCHMPDIDGDTIDGSAISFRKKKFDGGWNLQTRYSETVKHKQHNFYAGHDTIMLKSAISVEAGHETIKGEEYVVVRVTNMGTGHNFPTGTAKRRVNIFVSVEDGNGDFIGGGEIDLRKPKIEQGVEDTTVKDGEWNEFDFLYDKPKVPGGKFRVIVRYKHYPAATNDESIVLHDQFYPLPNK